jgi:hypothetical protein
VGQFSNQACPSALSYCGGKLSHRFLSDHASFAASKGGAGFLNTAKKLSAAALAFFPQSQRFGYGVSLTPQPPCFHDAASKLFLIGCKLHVH